MALKHPPETLENLCSVIADGTLNYAAACKAVGLPTRTFWHYVKLSQAGDEDLMIDFLGERVQFARAVNGARRAALHLMRGMMEQKSIFGYDEPVFFQGMPTWKPDPRCVGLDEETRIICGLPVDGLLRDENGAVVQNVVHHEPPVALQLRVAEMAFPGEYRPGVNSTVAVAATLGVSIVKPMAGPPVVPPAPVPPLPQLEVISDADQLAIPEMTEAEPDKGEEPDEDFTPSPLDEPVPVEPVIRQATPPQYAPTPQPAPLTHAERSGRPLSELERDLLSRARGPVEIRSAAVGIPPKIDRVS